MPRNNFQALQYARAQLGRPYWFGTFGQIANERLFKEKKKQFPKYYTAKDFPSQYGQKVHDCGGLAYKGYMMSAGPEEPAKYIEKYDVSVDRMINMCQERGEIKTMPDIPGIFVWKKGHGGIYEGNGIVIEAKGHSYGVVRTKNTDWKMWGKIPWWEYITLNSWVSSLYRYILDREPDALGFEFWLKKIRTRELTPGEIVRGFLLSEEFTNRKVSDSAFLVILYQVFFNREPDASGYSFWMDQIPNVGKSSVVGGFIASAEWSLMEQYLDYINK